MEDLKALADVSPDFRNISKVMKIPCANFTI